MMQALVATRRVKQKGAQMFGAREGKILVGNKRVTFCV